LKGAGRNSIDAFKIQVVHNFETLSRFSPHPIKPQTSPRFRLPFFGNSFSFFARWQRPSRQRSLLRPDFARLDRKAIMKRNISVVAGLAASAPQHGLALLRRTKVGRWF
jgi:hypothetical protein